MDMSGEKAMYNQNYAIRFDSQSRLEAMVRFLWEMSLIEMW
jgi:hypothetical protein